MSDVFISYAHSNRTQAQQVAEALRALGYGVWRDDELPAHRDYSEVIEERLRAAKAVVVVWCAEAVKSQWVRAEADLAREAGTMVQLTLDGSALPLPFNRIQCADLTGWSGDADAPGWRKVVASIRELVGSGAALNSTRPPDGPAPGLHSGPAWELIQDSFDPAEYADFEALYPATTEVILARRHRRHIEAWARIDKSDADAIAAFLETPHLFAALERAASAELQDLRNQREEAKERAAALGLELKRRRIGEISRSNVPRSVPGALWRDAIPGLAAGTCPEMVTIPPGTFVMGSPATEERREGHDGCEEPQHEVGIEYSFGVGRYPVTLDEFAVFVGESGHDMGDSALVWSDEGPADTAGKGWSDPGFSQTGRHPVCCVSWHDAQAYVAWLNGRLGLEGRADGYRLPSEAEWEYACRARTTTPFSFGPTISTAQANYDGRYPPFGAGERGEYRQKTTPVDSFPANAFGLYDMHGNVWEWCEDVWHENYVGAPNDGSAWTVGGDPSRRVVRGGTWYDPPQVLRSANRFGWFAPIRIISGVRLARTLSTA